METLFWLAVALFMLVLSGHDPRAMNYRGMALLIFVLTMFAHVGAMVYYTIQELS